MRSQGYCAASWQPEVVALACPITVASSCYCLNVSVSGADSLQTVVAALHEPLLALREAILDAMARNAHPG